MLPWENSGTGRAFSRSWNSAFIANCNFGDCSWKHVFPFLSSVNFEKVELLKETIIQPWTSPLLICQVNQNWIKFVKHLLKSKLLNDFYVLLNGFTSAENMTIQIYSYLKVKATQLPVPTIDFQSWSIVTRKRRDSCEHLLGQPILKLQCRFQPDSQIGKTAFSKGSC